MVNEIRKPHYAQIELTFGCNNKCPFCFTQTLQKKHPSTMTLNTAKKIADTFKKSGIDPIRIEFAMRGEPLLNPHWLTITKLFRKSMPNSQITLTTNGNLLNKHKAIRFFKNGGNILLIDCYNNTIHERKEYYKQFKPIEFYKSTFNPWHRHKPTTKRIVLLDDIIPNNKIKKSRIINNHAGNINTKYLEKIGITFPQTPLKKKYNKPWYELAILYDGTIPLCCEDANINTPLGNIHNITNITQFYKHNPKLNKIREYLYNKQRKKIKTCSKCTVQGGRVQFLQPPPYT